MCQIAANRIAAAVEPAQDAQHAKSISNSWAGSTAHSAESLAMMVQEQRSQMSTGASFKARIILEAGHDQLTWTVLAPADGMP